MGRIYPFIHSSTHLLNKYLLNTSKQLEIMEAVINTTSIAPYPNRGNILVTKTNNECKIMIKYDDSEINGVLGKCGRRRPNLFQSIRQCRMEYLTIKLKPED